jgi:hypothetical protein
MRAFVLGISELFKGGDFGDDVVELLEFLLREVVFEGLPNAIEPVIELFRQLGVGLVFARCAFIRYSSAWW